MNLIKKILAVYALIVFLGFFLSLYPLMIFFVQFKNARNINHWLYRIWGHLVFFFTGIWSNSKFKFKIERNKTYVFCANHTSYADIPTLYINIKNDITFIGKSSLGEVPLFGYIYKRIHILVNRKDANSRKKVIEEAINAINKGISPIIFPEGTIPKVGKRPEMIDFKDGAFIIAIETKTPIVPITILNNYKILPDDNKLDIKILPSKIIVHSPIETKDLTLEDIPALKQKTFDTIKNGFTE